MLVLVGQVIIGSISAFEDNNGRFSLLFLPVVQRLLSKPTELLLRSELLVSDIGWLVQLLNIDEVVLDLPDRLQLGPSRHWREERAGVN